ncbi:MFS transporter [Rhodococcoides kyotonense]|uniref:Predicted arabinose efflux permease, MFS family n=1 Tax=Rhodococcoides kyotonense TaxID=398843 RepID=A0A239GRB0_9NOCA|nr:MFS transporter [Rhodococcus kyotonensis]SNS71756.1 Predicted arabinose efflux permease, MFS family [Rhodococcus kyotonensis]
MTLTQDAQTKTARWILVAAGMFAVAWGGNEFTPLLVMYRLEHGFSAVTVDTFLFAYVIGIVPALLICGPLSDRLGRRPVMLPAPAVAAAGSILIALGADHAPVLFSGRVLSGVALGIGMAVGGSWIKELSAHDAPGAGARRAAMSLTAGFALGAGVAGILAQWAPWPTHLAYLVHVGICLVAGIAMLSVPESRPAVPRQDRASLFDDLKIPAASHRRFLMVVVPLAPWVFGAASVAYAVLPSLMADRSGGHPIALSALMSVIALGAGFAIQAVGRRIDTPNAARGALVGLTILVVGMLLAAWAASVLTIAAALIAATVLGCGYGMALVSGLQEVQRIAGPNDLAGLTAVFYSLTYLGFAVPAILSALTEQWPGVITYPGIFTVGAIIAAVCWMFVRTQSTSHLPVEESTMP